MDKKIMASLVVVVMLAVAVPAFAFADDSSDAAVPAGYGEFNVYVYTSASSKTLHEVSGYNAAIAVNQVVPLADMNYATNASGWYDINTNYGALPDSFSYKAKFLLIFNRTYTIENPVAYYFSDKTQTWEVADYTLGFYKPFSDYSSAASDDLRTANIAIVPGNVTNPSLPTSGLQDIAQVDYAAGSAYEVTFNLTANMDLLTNNIPYTGKSPVTDALITYIAANPIVVKGYGSDTYLALMDAYNRMPSLAVTSKGYVTDSGAIYTGYGSIQNMYGLLYGDNGQPYPATQYYYWSLFLGNSTNWQDMSSWLLGWMSPLDEASELNMAGFDFVQDVFTFQYSYS